MAKVFNVVPGGEISPNLVALQFPQTLENQSDTNCYFDEKYVTWSDMLKFIYFSL